MPTLRDKFNGTGLYLISKLTQKKGRFQVNGRENLDTAIASGRPLILTTWHGMTMMLVGYFAKTIDVSKVVLLMPDDWRGEALAIFARKVGGEPFPMNLKGDDSMGMARQFVKLVRKVKQGHYCYITPDGPDGPAYVIKPGVAFIAQKAGAYILPIGAYARHGYRLNRWDRYVIPYPFSRMSIEIGQPFEVRKDADLTAVTDHLTDILHRVHAQAAANYYEKR